MGIDKNMSKVLQNLEHYPGLMKRCRAMYLDRIVKSMTYKQIADSYHVNVTTVFKYVRAYQDIAPQFHEVQSVEDLVGSLLEEVKLLRKKRKEGLKPRDYSTLVKEIRSILGMIAELKGFLSRQPQVNVKILQNVMAIVSDTIPQVLESHVDKVLTRELIQEILEVSAASIEDKTSIEA